MMKKSELKNDRKELFLARAIRAECLKTEYNTLETHELIEFAQAWAGLGWAVQEQVTALLDGSQDPFKFNSNAIQLAFDRLQGYNEELDEELQDWLARNN